jgi:uncharacterized protein (TIGR03437 family)
MLSGLLPFCVAARALNLSQDLVPLGIASSNMLPDSPALDSRPLFEAAVAYATKNGVATITANPGAYYFLTLRNASTHALITAANNLTIDWQNSDLLFTKSNVAAVQCSNCSGFTMQNFTLDYQQLPFTQIAVASVNAAAQSFTFNTIAGYQPPSAFNTNRAADNSDAIWMFVFRNGVPIQQVGRIAAKRPLSGNTIALSDTTDPWASPANLAAIQPGDTVVFTDRAGPPAINFVNGQNVAIRSASIYSAGQIGLYFGRSNGATADHVQVIPKPGTTRLISTNADGIHTSFALGANIFTNNMVRRTCDDALAISAPWIATVTSASGNSVIVSRTDTAPFAPAAPVAFVDPKTNVTLGSATIVSETPPVPQQTVTNGETVTLTLDQAVTGLVANAGMMDDDPGKKGAGSVIAYNTVQDGVFARGVWLAGAQNVSVHDNYIQRTSSNGIFVQQLSANGTDAGPSAGITIQNNLVDSAVNYANVSHGVAFAAASIYTVSQNSNNAQVATSAHSNITVTRNRVTNSARSAIRLENVNTGQIAENTIQGFGLTPSVNAFTAPSCCETLAQYTADFSQAILTPSSTGVASTGNQSGGTDNLLISSSTASAYPRLAAGSFAAAYGAGLTSGTTVTLVDSAGASWPASILAASSNQVNFLVPDGAAAGIATVNIGSSSGSAQIDAIGPGLYSVDGSGTGVAAANAALYLANGNVVPQNVYLCNGAGCASSPLDSGQPGDQLIVSLYGTGIRNNSGLSHAFASIGAVRATILYAGPQGQFPGLDQINVMVPPALAGAGEVPVVVTLDGQTANPVTINVK